MDVSFNVATMIRQQIDLKRTNFRARLFYIKFFFMIYWKEMKEEALVLKDEVFDNNFFINFSYHI